MVPERNLRYNISGRFGALETKAYSLYFSIMAVLKILHKIQSRRTESSERRTF